MTNSLKIYNNIMALRKKNDVWDAIDDQRPANIKLLAWHQSYEGVYAALVYLGYEVVTTKDKFDAMEIPKDKKGYNNYMGRKIIVKRNDIESIPVQFASLLCGSTYLQTDEEYKLQNKKLSDEQKIKQPKGQTNTNNLEKLAIDNLHTLINIGTYLTSVHLLEFRLADVAYSMITNDIETDLFAADQVKAARVNKHGSMTINHKGSVLNVESMIKILENNMSLTIIGMDKECNVEVVWFFYDQDALNMLKQFDNIQYFAPRLYLKKISSYPFTIAYNNPKFRFEVKKSEDDRIRLIQFKIDFVNKVVKNTIQFLNEDDSQIPALNHRIEQKSFNIIREAINKIGFKIIRLQSDNYTQTDLRVNDAKIQNKVGTYMYTIRNRGRIPYNPDEIDIMQFSNIETKVIYAIPMRKIVANKIESTFTDEELMVNTIKISVALKERFKEYMFDLSNILEIEDYYKLCETARNIPPLSDKEFYSNIIKENQDKFLTRKELKKKST